MSGWVLSWRSRPGGVEVEDEEVAEEEEEKGEREGVLGAYADNALSLRNSHFHRRIYPAQCAGLP